MVDFKKHTTSSISHSWLKLKNHYKQYIPLVVEVKIHTTSSISHSWLKLKNLQVVYPTLIVVERIYGYKTTSMLYSVAWVFYQRILSNINYDAWVHNNYHDIKHNYHLLICMQSISHIKLCHCGWIKQM